MAFTPFVATVKGSNPERFFMGEIDLDFPTNFMNTSDFLIEEDFRELLSKENIQPDAIEALVAEARKRPA